MKTDEQDDDPAGAAQPFQELSEHIGNAPVAPPHAIAAIALAMAMKYHDISTIQDGTLYQQYKLEGRNLQALHLDMVLETAIRLEKHLLGSSERIAAMLIEAIAVEVDDEDAADAAAAQAALKEADEKGTVDLDTIKRDIE